MIFCRYCGFTKEITREHVIPSSYNGPMRRFDVPGIVKACSSCNSHLSDVNLHSVEERAQWLYETFRVKYRKLLAMEDWTKEELDQMGNSIKTCIEGQIYEKCIVAMRIENLKLVASGLNPIPFD